MKKTFAVIGLGRFGLSIFKELVATNQDVIAIDILRDNVKKASEFSDKCFICDATDKKGLVDLGIKNVDHAIVSVPSDLQASILSTIILNDLKIPRITVRIDDELYRPVFLKLGATDVINPQEIIGARLANNIVSSNLTDYYKIDSDYGVAEIKVGENFTAIDIEKFNPRNNYNVNVMVVRKGNKALIANRKTMIEKNDTLIVFGRKEDLIKLGVILNKN